MVQNYLDNENEEIVQATTEKAVDQNGNNKPKLKPKKKVPAIVIVAAATVVFFALAAGFRWFTVLTFVGLVEIIASIVVLVKWNKRRKFICPECGTTRIYHCTLLETKTQCKSQLSNIGRDRIQRQCQMTMYRYHYEKTYECPECSTIDKSQTWDDGGILYQYYDGVVVDKRKPIKEC